MRSTTSEERAQVTPPSRDWARQQRRAGEAAREVFPRRRVVEVERENVGRAQWEIELLVEGGLYEVRIDQIFGVIGFDREAVGKTTSLRTGP